MKNEKNSSITYFINIINNAIGIVDKSNQKQPQIHISEAIKDLIGDSHSKQLLYYWYNKIKVSIL